MASPTLGLVLEDILTMRYCSGISGCFEVWGRSAILCIPTHLDINYKNKEKYDNTSYNPPNNLENAFTYCRHGVAFKMVLNLFNNVDVVTP